MPRTNLFLPWGTASRVTAGIIAALLLAGCGGKGAVESPSPDQAAVPSRPLYAVPLAGEKVAVLPLSMILADRPLSTEAPFTDRVAALRWCDSLLGYALVNRAPDVAWVLPPELRRIAHRAPGVAPDPDRMGQSVMGAPKLDFMPDPLRSYARSLVALAGGRMVLIPAAASFAPAGSAIKADLSLVMADARNGRVMWRTLAVGQGATAEAAMEAALKTVPPLPSDGP